MIFSILTMSIGCGQKKDNKEISSKEEPKSVNKEQVNETQTIIKFYCFEKPKEELTPSSKIEKGV